MTRKLGPQMGAVEPNGPVKVITEATFDDCDDNSYKGCRATSPFVVGDVVPYRADDGTVNEALIVVCLVQNMPSGRYLNLYKVRRKTKKGAWSGVWSYLWPGAIDRSREPEA